MHKDLKNMMATASKYRGDILNEVSLLEYAIDRYICDYFVGDSLQKNEDMKVAILGNNRMTLDGKKQVFEYLANKYDSSWTKNYKSIRSVKNTNSKKPPKRHTLNSDLQFIISERNVIAHYIIDSSKDVLEQSEDVINFVRFKDEIKMFTYNKEKVDLICNLTANISLYILQRIKH
jgi:hypothetical protein